jgi:uncharacterized protein YcfJ
MAVEGWGTSRKSVAVMAAVALVLSGCAMTQSQRIGADDGSDVCRPYLVALDATGDYFAEKVVTGALIGAVTGAALGAAIGGDAKSAGLGALGGAAAGGTAGYVMAKNQQRQDKAVLYSTAMSKYDSELAKIDEADLAFKKLQDCRNDTLRQVAADYKQSRISRDEAKARWRQSLDRKSRDLQIAQAMGDKMPKHLAELEAQSAQVSAVPWDEKTYAQIAEEERALRRKHEEEQRELRKEYRAKKAEYAAAQTRLKAKQEDESYRLQQKKAGKIPTSTAQTHIQSYNTSVAAANASYKAQVATADNPDGFEAAVPHSAGWLTPEADRFAVLDQGMPGSCSGG